ncbi:unnamed protein product [Ambrosiozyma monospora]|uniref:Unnamed protein product n=1 Tax=Ambrosiozyma monospora TaxID=43982 RepID=A0ACB5SWS8_AMBMO|nr:unnamed protein product [Ambrosiozyma monospora]
MTILSTHNSLSSLIHQLISNPSYKDIHQFYLIDLLDPQQDEIHDENDITNETENQQHIIPESSSSPTPVKLNFRPTVFEFQTISKIKYVPLNNLPWSQSKLQALFVYLCYIEADLALSEDPIDTTTATPIKENSHNDDNTTVNPDIEMDVDASMSSISTSASSPSAMTKVNSKSTMIIINGLLEELSIASSNMISKLTDPIPSAASKPTTTGLESQHSESPRLTLSQILEDYNVERAMMIMCKIKMLEFDPRDDDECACDTGSGSAASGVSDTVSVVLSDSDDIVSRLNSIYLSVRGKDVLGATVLDDLRGFKKDWLVSLRELVDRFDVVVE